MLSPDDVKKIAHLARLNMDEADIPAHQASLSQILTLVEQMDQVPTNGILPMAHPLDATQRLRQDTVTETNQRDDFQSLAPQAAAGFYLVPRTVE